MLSRDRLECTWNEDAHEDPVALVRRLFSNGLFAEAVAVASPVLYEAAEKLAADGANTRTAGRIARALMRYHLRTAARATPFGLMAGVAVAGFGSEPVARLGTEHRKLVRLGRSWLRQHVAATLPETPLDEFWVVVNNLGFDRGDRVALRFALSSSDEPVERSLRRSGVVRSALRHAARPINAAELVAALDSEFPDAPNGATATVVRRLVATDFLLTDQFPALNATRVPDVAQVSSRCRAYADRPLGAGIAELASVRAAAGSDESVHVDLALDADVQLPDQVARELELAASVLWRLSFPHSTEYALASYHLEFLERYGAGRLVPVTEVLDPDAGLGPPAGYLLPVGWRSPVERPLMAADRARSLLDLAMSAVRDGKREVELEAHTLAELAHDARPPAGHLEIVARLTAASATALCEGDFTLTVVSAGGGAGGTNLGRFVPVLGLEDFSASLRANAAEHWGPLPVQVSHGVARERFGNVARVPPLVEHQVVVGDFVDESAPGVIALSDIAVVADAERFRLRSLSLGQEIRPFFGHALRPESTVPNVARFLVEAGAMGQRRVSLWDWGPATGAPFLPAVRSGRTVLAPATWSPSSGLTSDAELLHWCEQWAVPEVVEMGIDDEYLPLHLGFRAHRDLLREELGRRERTVLREPPWQDVKDGWLAGPQGRHDAEIIASLKHVPARPAGHTEQRPAGPEPVGTTVIRLRDNAFLPGGGDWLYAKLRCSPARQNEVLSRYVAPLLAAHEWFFVRYSDPGPHLRLRVRGAPSALWGEVLPELRSLVSELVDLGLSHGMELDCYRPEEERYGGPAAMELAERVFFADTEFVLGLQLDPAGQDELSGARDVLALASHLIGEGWREGLLAAFGRSDELHRAVAAERRLLLKERPRDDVLPKRMRDSLVAYGEVLGPQICPGVLATLLHMHCNRRYGIDRVVEGRTLAIARGVAAAELARSRATGGEECAQRSR
ncbi:lantibiotic dehydratase [Lentzea sp. NPDC004782]|uniref:lantibiotic dehydratase n=1 Tax=Lentzea sp. NPDC004782 TaxID=3154458 RepID=UPI0033A26F86